MYEKWKPLLITSILVCGLIVKTSSSEPLSTQFQLKEENKDKLKYNDLNYLDDKIRLKLDTLYSHEVDVLVKLKKESSGFDKFALMMKFRESGFDYDVINSFGYYGAYQFGTSALKDLGIKKNRSFLNDHHLQDAAFIAYCKRNKWILKKYIRAYKGKRINGITITESGLLAAAHLKGAGTVIRWLKLNGRMSYKAKCDAYGTNLESYMKWFSGFDTSTLVASRKVCFKLNS